MTKEIDDIWTRIEEQRANYSRIINAATDTINNARKLIADARDGMDALPVAKVRRPRMPKEALPGQGELPAQQERDLRAIKITGFTTEDES